MRFKFSKFFIYVRNMFVFVFENELDVGSLVCVIFFFKMIFSKLFKIKNFRIFDYVIIYF